jgi:SpoVK/Ycf46/Vps4 family AAA+-type ATPase
MSSVIGVTNEDVRRDKFGDHQVVAHIYNAARKVAVGILETDSIVSSLLPSVVRNEMGNELKQNRVVHIGMLYEHLFDFVNDDEDPDHELKEKPTKHHAEFTQNINNAVLYNEEFQVVIVACSKFKLPYYESVTYVAFAENIERVESYCDHVMEKSRHKYENSVMLMTDTSNGIERKMLPKDSRFNLDDVVLSDSVKDEIIQSVRSFFEEKEGFYEKYNIPYRRGILLYGKPGNGKTTLIKAIANYIKEPAVYWQVNENTGSHSIEQVFKHVKSIAPTLLVIEDIDSIPESMRSMFLNYLDGAQNNEGVFIVGTTNYPDKIDPALMNRAGRFDRAYEIKLPSEEARYSYLIRIGMGNLVESDEVKLAASLMDGFSMSILNELYTLTALEHYYNGGEVDVERIVERLKDTQDKQKKNTWMQNERNVVGFS